MKFFKVILPFIFSSLLFGGQIAPGVKEVRFKKDGKEYVIKRDVKQIPKMYQKTTIGVIAPMKLADGVETIGELEILDYLKKSATDSSIVVVDARTEDWHEKIRIPATTNIPYTLFSNKDNAIETINLEFDVEVAKDGKLDFSNAKTVVVYCNGIWCKQSAMLIKEAKYSLLKLGYPPNKIKYYRGGMQSWVTLGLTTESDKEDK